MSTPVVKYSPEQLVEAYNAWVAEAPVVAEVADAMTLNGANYRARQDAWETYCDIRDQLPLGTTQARRLGATSGNGPRLVLARATYPAVTEP